MLLASKSLSMSVICSQATERGTSHPARRSKEKRWSQAPSEDFPLRLIVVQKFKNKAIPNCGCSLLASAIHMPLHGGRVYKAFALCFRVNFDLVEFWYRKGRGSHITI